MCRRKRQSQAAKWSRNRIFCTEKWWKIRSTLEIVLDTPTVPVALEFVRRERKLEIEGVKVNLSGQKLIDSHTVSTISPAISKELDLGCVRYL